MWREGQNVYREVPVIHEAVQAKRDQIEALCRGLAVRRLDVFGSATGDSFGSGSDVDLLVEFESATDFYRYFDLKERLEAILERPVDLVTLSSLENPFFREPVMATRQTIYAA